MTQQVPDQLFPMRCGQHASFDSKYEHNPYESPNGLDVTKENNVASPNPFDDPFAKPMYNSMNSLSLDDPQAQQKLDWKCGYDSESAGFSDTSSHSRTNHSQISSIDSTVMDDFLHAFDATTIKVSPCAEGTPEEISQPRKKSLTKMLGKSCESIDVNYNAEAANLSASKVNLKKSSQLKYEIKSRGIAGNVRKYAVTEGEKDVYKIMISLDPLVIHIDDENNDTLLTIKQKLLSIHPYFSVKLKGIKYAKCTQRFKFNSKKFNYKKADGRELKMIGEYNHHFGIFDPRDRERMIAKIWDHHTEFKLDIDAEKQDVLHVIALCTIMLQQRSLGVMSGKGL